MAKVISHHTRLYWFKINLKTERETELHWQKVPTTQGSHHRFEGESRRLKRIAKLENDRRYK